MAESKASGPSAAEWEVAEIEEETGGEIYNYLRDKAAVFDIDLSGHSTQSAVFRHLLQEILVLDKQRVDPSYQSKSDLDFKDPQASTNASPFSLELYISSPQSLFYSQLLDVRNKLQYEDTLLRPAESATDGARIRNSSNQKPLDADSQRLYFEKRGHSESEGNNNDEGQNDGPPDIIDDLSIHEYTESDEGSGDEEESTDSDE